MDTKQVYQSVTYGGESITVVPFARTTVTYQTQAGKIVDTITFMNDSYRTKTYRTPVKTVRLPKTDLPLVVVMESVL